MKKSFLFAAASLALVSMAACSGNCSKDGACKKSDVKEVYTGVLPAADCDGIRYTLLLDYDDNAKKGDYNLVETYIEADTTAMIGYKDLKTFVSEGDFTVETRGGKTYLKLVEDPEDSQAGAATTPLYFLVDSDTAITMTNADLEVSTTPGLNYTLTK